MWKTVNVSFSEVLNLFKIRMRISFELEDRLLNEKDV